MQFLQELHEARMTRNSNNQRMLTYADCRERAYLMLLMLQVMRYYNSYRPRAAKYAYKTVMYRNYNIFRVDGSDLYNLFYFITGNESALSKLKNPGAAKQERATISLSIPTLNDYLRSLASNDKASNKDILLLGKIEKELKINNKDYKEIRRRLGVYTSDSQADREITVTRLLFAARAKLSDSDFLADFTRLTLDKNLENFSATNPEPTPSIPDNSIPLSDIKNYRFLVSPKSLPFIAKFLQASLSGKTVISTFVKHYAPIISMIDDIVRAGPAYTEQLKQLHKRAKRDLNK